MKDTQQAIQDLNKIETIEEAWAYLSTANIREWSEAKLDETWSARKALLDRMRLNPALPRLFINTGRNGVDTSWDRSGQNVPDGKRFATLMCGSASNLSVVIVEP